MNIAKVNGIELAWDSFGDADPSATYWMIEGMGHDLPSELDLPLINAIREVAEKGTHHRGA